MRYGALEGGGTKMVLAVADENMNILTRESIPTTLPEETTERMIAFFRENPVDVVVLTIPQNAAQNTANRLIDLGIQGFWNFTNVELSSTRPNVKIENIHFADSLLTLSYRIANP